jgi:putative ABC transport system ATP-binding protein
MSSFAADCPLANRDGGVSGLSETCWRRRRIYNVEVQTEQSSPIILTENLTKVYLAGRIRVTAVRGVSMAVERGEFVAIVGPSGSGKSTLFYLLGGLTQATGGRVVVDGVDFATLSDAERTRLRKHRIGFVFQKFNLLPTLTAMGNIEIAWAVSGRSAGGKKEPLDLKYLDHLSDLLSIQGRLDHRPSELSGGEQQRVAIARALITRPAIVLADEPTGNLDTKNSEAVLHMLLRSNRELGQTTLMITHNPEAAAIASRILYMRDGQIVHEEKGARSDIALPVPGAALAGAAVADAAPSPAAG